MKTLILSVMLGLTFSAEAAWRCSTSSNGLNFAGKGQTRTEASRNTVRRCNQSHGTNSGDCRLNLNCQGSSTGGNGGGVVTYPRVSCNTESNGLFFTESGRNSYNVRERAINSCQSSYRTTSFECRVNVSCNDGSYTAPMVRCETRSRGQVFSDESRDRFQTKNHVVSKCMNAYNTDYYQCRNNARCGSDIYTTPVRPVVGFNSRVLDVASKISAVASEMRWTVPYYLSEGNVKPLIDQANVIKTRVNNVAPARRVKRAMVKMRELIINAQVAVDSVYSWSEREDFRRRLNRLDNRLSNLIAEINSRIY